MPDWDSLLKSYYPQLKPLVGLHLTTYETLVCAAIEWFIGLHHSQQAEVLHASRQRCESSSDSDGDGKLNN